MVIMLLIGFAAGIVSGMGIGGGAILIPCLCAFAGLSQPEAQGVNLLYFLPTAAIAVVTHAKNKQINKKMVKGMLWYGVIGAAAGALLALAINPELLRRLFGFFLLLLGAHEIFKKENNSVERQRQE